MLQFVATLLRDIKIALKLDHQRTWRWLLLSPTGDTDSLFVGVVDACLLTAFQNGAPQGEGDEWVEWLKWPIGPIMPTA